MARLFVHFHRGVALADTQIFGAQDPFCIVKLGGSTGRTRAHEAGDCEPVWDGGDDPAALQPRMVLPVPDPAPSLVEIECWNENTAVDDLIGKGALALATLPDIADGGASGAAGWQRELALEPGGALQVTLFRAPADEVAWPAARCWDAVDKARAAAAAADAAASSASLAASVESTLPQLSGDGGATTRNCWSAGDVTDLPVRGGAYLSDGVKVKTSAPAFTMVGLDLLAPPSAPSNEGGGAAGAGEGEPAGAAEAGGGGAEAEKKGGWRRRSRPKKSGKVAAHSVCAHPNNLVQRRRRQQREAAAGGAAGAGAGEEFFFVMHFDLGFASFVSYFSSGGQHGGTRDTGGADPAFDRLAARFFAPGPGGDDFRRARLKILPRVVAGPWVVEKAVGLRPAILGDRIRQTFFHGDGYLECHVDISSSTIATKLMRLCTKVVTRLTMDLALIIQGEAGEELPERVLGCCRFHQMDLTKSVDQESMARVELGDADAEAAALAGGRERLESCDMEAAADDIANDMRSSSIAEEGGGGTAAQQ
jgi:hypothetical protein